VTVPWTGADEITGLVVLADGKLVVAGDNGSAFKISRFTASGALDTSFGIGGTATLSLGSVWADSFGLQADGKLVIGGLIGPQPGAKPSVPELARFNADGTLDTTFDSAGAVPGTVTFSFPDPHHQPVPGHLPRHRTGRG
jgi:uncharacterized delta-60 repeat protein